MVPASREAWGGGEEMGEDILLEKIDEEWDEELSKGRIAGG